MIVLIDYGDKEYYVRAKCLYLYLYYLHIPILSYLNYIYTELQIVILHIFNLKTFIIIE